MRRLSAIILALLLGMAFFACSKGQTAPEEESGILPLPSPTPSPSPSSAVNPVSIYYSEYYETCQPRLDMLSGRLSGDASQAAAESLLYLSAHSHRVSEGLATFGWLLSTDAANSFASSVSGAADGSGAIALAADGYDEEELFATPAPTIEPLPEDEEDEEPAEDEELLLERMPRLPYIPAITPTPSPDIQPSASPENGPEVYSMQFTYASGRLLRGMLQGGRLLFYSPEDGGAKTELLLQDGVWTSTVYFGDGLVSVLSCDEAGGRFSVSRQSGGGESVLYAWMCDSTGIKKVEGMA